MFSQEKKSMSLVVVWRIIKAPACYLVDSCQSPDPPVQLSELPRSHGALTATMHRAAGPGWGDEDRGGVGDTPGLGDAKTWIIPNRNLGFL